MTLKKLVILIVAVDFAILTALALWKQGLMGMIQLATGNWMGMTLTADLCISLNPQSFSAKLASMHICEVMLIPEPI